MQIDIRYGRGSIACTIPDDASVSILRKPAMPLLADPSTTIAQCLSEVPEIAKGKNSVCILVCDITRPVPNGLFLQQLIDNLVAGGIDKDRIVVLIATGLHRPNEGSELDEVLGDDEISRQVVVENHEARDSAAHIKLGDTTSGTPIELDKRFIEADLKIVTGLVEPHFMAGWSGGRKVILPGIASAETIRRFHSAKFLEDPLAVGCNLEGNPLHREQLEVVSMLERSCGESIYAINTVIDEDRRLAFCNFGEIRESHLEAVRFAHQYCVVDVRQKFETVLTSSAGYPLDQTYYQTVKGMVNPISIVEDAGNLIVASECSEGLGSNAFKESQKRLIREGSTLFINRIKQQQLAAIDEWESEMQVKATSVARVQLFSEGLEEEDRELTGVEMIDSVQDAINQSLESSRDKSIAVLPEGPYVTPRLVV